MHFVHNVMGMKHHAYEDFIFSARLGLFAQEDHSCNFISYSHQSLCRGMLMFVVIICTQVMTDKPEDLAWQLSYLVYVPS